MPRHPKPEAKPVQSTIHAVRPTCHLCSWVRDLIEGDFFLKRPSLACEEKSHRRLLMPASPAKLAPLPLVPLEDWLQAS
jgi:hypothetical protein